MRETEEVGNDKYIEVSHNEINIYSSDELKLELKVHGLSIREAQDVHDNYLYTISNNIVKPYQIVDYRNEDLVGPITTAQPNWRFS